MTDDKEMVAIAANRLADRQPKDDEEGLAVPTDGLIQRPLLIREARIIGPHVRDGIVVRLFTSAR